MGHSFASLILYSTMPDLASIFKKTICQAEISIRLEPA